jgi:hypothetical protein
VGVELIFVDDPGFVEMGEFRARLVAPVPGALAPSCRFDIRVEGSYVASQSPPQPGTAITLQGAISVNELVPPLPAGFEGPSFESTLIVGDPLLGGLRLDGFFAALAQVGASTLAQQIYLAGTEGGSFARVSVSSEGAPGDGDSSNADLSHDGRCLVFDSEAENLVAGDANGERDVFGVDLDADGDGILAETDEPGAVTTVRLSATAAGGELSGPSFSPRISADCERVLYLTGAPDAVPGDTNQKVDAVLLLRDADADDVLDEFGEPGAVALVRVSLDASGEEVSGDVLDADLSGSGRFAAFTAAAGAAFVPDDTNAHSDVYLLDLEDGILERVSLDIGRSQVAADARAAALSDDETAVVFESDGALVPGDPAGSDVYRFDRLSADLELLTAGRSGGSGAGAPAPNGDGLVVALDSADALVPGDGGAPQDVFVAFRGDDGDATSLNHFPLAGWPDDDLSDRVLEAFDSASGAYLPGAHVAAMRVETAAGMALAQVREASQGGVDLNSAALTRLPESATSGEDDSDDDVAFLYRARPDDRLVNLGVAVAGGDLSAEVACLIVDEAGQQTVLNGDGAADDGVLAWISSAGAFAGEVVHNTGIAASEVRAVGDLCVALAPESAGVGGLAGHCAAQGPGGCDLNGDGDFDDLGPVVVRTADGSAFSLGVAAVAFDFGPGGNAIFVTDEAGDRVDLNGDGQLDDRVPQYLDLDTLGGPPLGPGPGERDRLRSLGPAWSPCDEPACGAFPAISRVGASFISYTGHEADNAVGPFCQTGVLSICDSNDDGEETRVVWVAAVAGGAVSRLQSLPFEPEQETEAFPTEVGGKRTLYREWTECQAAAFRCGREGFELPDPLPAAIPIAPQSCAAAVDIALPQGVLDCNELVLYIAGDGDLDGVLDPIDNAPLVFNDDQSDSDEDGWGDVIDPNPTEKAVDRFGCDFDQDGDVDQEDIDLQLPRLGQPSTDAALEPLGVAGGDAFDLNQNWRIDVGDLRACVALCTQPDCAVVNPPVGPSRTRCGLLGVEALVPLLALAWRRRAWRRPPAAPRNDATQYG